MSFEKLDTETFISQLQEIINNSNFQVHSLSTIDMSIRSLSDSILCTYHNQGKMVTSKPARHKAWWDPNTLNPILKNRNRALKWWRRCGSPVAYKCYRDWQRYFRQEIFRAKLEHWKKFLANSSGVKAFKALKYVKPPSSGEIAPLYRADGSITSDKEDQADLLFHGTSVAHIEADLSDIPPEWSASNRDPRLDFIPLSLDEIEPIINHLPVKKARGPDQIANKLIKTAYPIINSTLQKIFNACLELGYFPNSWRTATTAIIRKQDKDCYSHPNAYRPIALLCCLGKVFEKIITNRVTCWAETTGALSKNHMGGRKQYSVEDAGVILTTWIRNKWQEGKIVAGLFLDVKSAYPSVHKLRLLYSLQTRHCPLYLLNVIDGFLSNRTTTLKLQDYTSHIFSIENGLPQGSPLSVILYILYNSSLLIPTILDPSTDEIFIAFIDDVSQLVAHKDPTRLIEKIEHQGQHSLDWGKRFGAIFDKKKANLMFFTKKTRFTPSSINFGEFHLQPQTKV